jgi:predicted nucleic acid-binding protein
MSVLVDSDVLIEVSRARNTAIVSRWLALGASGELVLYSPVSAAELWAGARPNEHDVTSNLFGSLTCVPIDEDAGRRAGAYLQRFAKSHGVEIADALIAAGAVQNQARLWTLNRKHYPMKDLSFFEL